MKMLARFVLLAALAPAAYSQMQPGDLLLNSFRNPDALVHYRPDGTVVQTSSAGSGSLWEGSAILPDGNWVTTRRRPKNGVNIFDGVTGAEIARIIATRRRYQVGESTASIARDFGVSRQALD